ncbi:hypothetical protein QOT17_003635 [Balamuthia mandrillaris]
MAAATTTTKAEGQEKEEEWFMQMAGASSHKEEKDASTLLSDLNALEETGSAKDLLIRVATEFCGGGSAQAKEQQQPNKQEGQEVSWRKDFDGLAVKDLKQALEREKEKLADRERELYEECWRSCAGFLSQTERLGEAQQRLLHMGQTVEALQRHLEASLTQIMEEIAKVED